MQTTCLPPSTPLPSPLLMLDKSATRAPHTPRYQYFPDPSSDDDEPSLPSPTFSLHWTGDPPTPTEELVVLVLSGAVGDLTKPTEGGRKGVLSAEEKEVATIQLEGGVALVILGKEIPVEWEFAVGGRLVEVLLGLADKISLTILTPYTPQTYISPSPSPSTPPPIRHLRTPTAPFLPNIADYPSPNYVSGVEAALMNSVSRSKTPGTILLLPTPLHPALITQSISLISTGPVQETVRGMLRFREGELISEKRGRVDGDYASMYM